MQKKDVLISVGILFLLVGAVLIVMAGPSASSNDSNNPEKYALWRGGSADNVTLPLGEDRNEFTIYIKKGGEYDSISIKDSEGSELFRSDSCTNYNFNGDFWDSWQGGYHVDQHAYEFHPLDRRLDFLLNVLLQWDLKVLWDE